jgi:hypothetical protein
VDEKYLEQPEAEPKTSEAVQVTVTQEQPQEFKPVQAHLKGSDGKDGSRAYSMWCWSKDKLH